MDIKGDQEEIENLKENQVSQKGRGSMKKRNRFWQTVLGIMRNMLSHICVKDFSEKATLEQNLNALYRSLPKYKVEKMR